MEIGNWNENRIREAAEKQGFGIVKILYDPQTFGNIYVKIQAEPAMVAEFIQDRGQFWCRISIDGKMYFWGDICSGLHIQDCNAKTFISYVENTLLSLKENLTGIKSFSKKRLQ